MTFEDFIKYIPKIEKMSVPGASSHIMMTSDNRKKVLETKIISKRNAREAAVLILLYPKQNSTHIALIRRPIYKGVHSGQIALPGGKVEAEDASLEETALRETREEIGVPEHEIKVIKEMTKVYIPPSNFWVYPFMGMTKEYPVFQKQKEEVADILEIPVELLLNDKAIKTQSITNSYVTNLKVPSFDLNGATVWGATAMMLNECKVLLKKVIAT